MYKHGHPEYFFLFHVLVIAEMYSAVRYNMQLVTGLMFRRKSSIHQKSDSSGQSLITFKYCVPQEMHFKIYSRLICWLEHSGRISDYPHELQGRLPSCFTLAS